MKITERPPQSQSAADAAAKEGAAVEKPMSDAQASSSLLPRLAVTFEKTAGRSFFDKASGTPGGAALQDNQGKISPELAAKLDAIEQANAARMAAGLKEMKNMLREMPGLSEQGALVDPMGSGLRADGSLDGLRSRIPNPGGSFESPNDKWMPAPTTPVTSPRNAGPSEKGGMGDLASAWRPSTNPRDWMSGSAAKDGGTGKRDEIVRSVTRPNGDGTTTTTETRLDRQTRAVTQTRTLNDADGNPVGSVRVTRNADGSSNGEPYFRTEAGWISNNWALDSRGNSAGGYIEHYDRHHNRIRVIPMRMPTEDDANPLAVYPAARFSHRPHTPPPEVNKVNPGAPNDSGPRAPKIDPGEGIVIKPATESSGQSREMSAELAALMRDHIRKNPAGTQDGNPGEPE